MWTINITFSCYTALSTTITSYLVDIPIMANILTPEEEQRLWRKFQLVAEKVKTKLPHRDFFTIYRPTGCSFQTIGSQVMMMASEPFVPQIISRACSASNVLEAPVDLETALAIDVKELVANTTDLDKVHLQRTHIDAILHKINGKDKIDYEKDPKPVWWPDWVPWAKNEGVRAIGRAEGKGKNYLKVIQLAYRHYGAQHRHVPNEDELQNEPTRPLEEAGSPPNDVEHLVVQPDIHQVEGSDLGVPVGEHSTEHAYEESGDFFESEDENTSDSLDKLFGGVESALAAQWAGAVAELPEYRQQSGETMVADEEQMVTSSDNTIESDPLVVAELPEYRQPMATSPDLTIESDLLMTSPNQTIDPEPLVTGPDQTIEQEPLSARPDQTTEREPLVMRPEASGRHYVDIMDERQNGRAGKPVLRNRLTRRKENPKKPYSSSK